jgi:hypothetical protein
VEITAARPVGAPGGSSRTSSLGAKTNMERPESPHSNEAAVAQNKAIEEIVGARIDEKDFVSSAEGTPPARRPHVAPEHRSMLSRCRCEVDATVQKRLKYGFIGLGLAGIPVGAAAGIYGGVPGAVTMLGLFAAGVVGFAAVKLCAVTVS